MTESSTLEDFKNRYILFASSEAFSEAPLSELLGTYNSMHDAMFAVPVNATMYCIFDRRELKVVFTGFGNRLRHHKTH
jgi:hypothetical protein